MNEKYYVRDWGRPCGVEPKIYMDRNKAEVTDNFAQFYPEVVEFKTEIEARMFIRCQTNEKIEWVV